jgi:tetratricopeptide (TPR) repeat protein
MKNTRTILFLLLSLSLSSCATSHFGTTDPPLYWGIVPLSFTEVVAEPAAYSTEKGRRLIIKYERNLENIFTQIRKTYRPSEIEFVPNIGNKSAGLSFMKLIESKGDERFLTLAVMSPFAFFDKRQSTYQERAAALFAAYMRGLMEIALQETQVIDDSDVAGLWISIAWSTLDANSVKRGEGFDLIATKGNCKSFVSQTLTPQDFISVVTIKGFQEGKDLGKVSLTVGPTVKAPNTMEKKGFALSLYETGTELIVARKPRVAISFFDRAIELAPDYAEAYYFRGSAYASLSMHDAARKDLENALQSTQEGGFEDFVKAGLAALNANYEESCRLLTRAISAEFKSDTGIGITSAGILNVVKHDANFNAIRSARCFKEIMREK